MNVRERIEQLEPRERRLLAALVGVFALMVVFLIPILIGATVSSHRSENERLHEAIEEIYSSRERLQKLEAEKREIEQRYAQPAPPLAGYLDKVATDLGIEIPESQDRPVVPHGKRFEERSTKLVLNRIGMLSLVNLLEKVENSGYPVRISAVNIRKRPTDPDSYDVNVTVSAFDRQVGPVQKAAEAEGEEAEE